MPRNARASLLAGACLGVAFLPGRSARAVDAPGDDDHAQPCRPTITCTAEIMSPGQLELELGGQQAHASGANAWSVPFLLKQGLSSWLEAQVGSNGFTLLRDGVSLQYLDNVNVGPKLRFVEQGEVVPTLSASAQVSVPTFAADGYAHVTDLLFVAYASKDIGPIHVDLNGGFNVLNLSGAVTQGTVSGVLSKSLPLNLGVELEAYYLSEALPVLPHDGGGRAALTFSPKPWLVLDAGGDIGFFWSVRQYTLFAGLTVIPVVFWRPESGGK
jgi:hypothetical protein